MSDTGLTLADSIVIDEKVVFRELDGETVILNLESGIYFGLDDIGTRMWTLLREHQRLHTVLDLMLAEYDVPEATLQAHLLRLAGELSTHGLAQIKRHGADRPSP